MGQGATEGQGGSMCTPLPNPYVLHPSQRLNTLSQAGVGRGAACGGGCSAVRHGRGAWRAQPREAQALQPRAGQRGPLTGVTELALPAAGAEAAEGVHLVDAGAPVAARLAQAVVNVCGRRA